MVRSTPRRSHVWNRLTCPLSIASAASNWCFKPRAISSWVCRAHALDVLDRVGDPEMLGEHALYLQGEGLRALGLFREALKPLARASRENPDNVHVWLALGWCHKRTGRVDLAIESLEGGAGGRPE